ncbi:hypothetical protein [Nocardioides sp.]|uniref:hypothetical protein n=1 Tax=Nocardioides sp. TaxID=35761 RepID=UPI0039E427E8
MFYVVTCGFAAAPLESLPAHRQAVTLPHPRADDFLDRALDLLLTEEWEEATVLLLHDGSAAGERRLRMLRAMLQRSRLLPVGVRLPLTGLAGLATVLSTLAAARLNAGAVVSALPWVLDSVITRGVTRSVAKLDYPGIGFGHQLSTLMPSSTLLMRFGSPLVTGTAAAAALPDNGQVALLEAGDRRLAERIGAPPASLAQTLQVTGATQLMEGWWGTGRYFEQTVVPTDLSPVTTRITSFPWRRCRECADAMNQFCQFCSAQEVHP